MIPFAFLDNSLEIIKVLKSFKIEPKQLYPVNERSSDIHILLPTQSLQRSLFSELRKIINPSSINCFKNQGNQDLGKYGIELFFVLYFEDYQKWKSKKLTELNSFNDCANFLKISTTLIDGPNWLNDYYKLRVIFEAINNWYLMNNSDCSTGYQVKFTFESPRFEFVYSKSNQNQWFLYGTLDHVQQIVEKFEGHLQSYFYSHFKPLFDE